MGDIISRLGHLFVQSAPTAIFVFVLLVILDRLFFRRLTEVLSEREARTAGALERAREQAALAETRAREYEAAFQAVRQEIYRQRESERREALLGREEALHKAREESVSLLTQMQAELTAEVQRAKNELRAASEGLAQEIIQSVLGNESEIQPGGTR